MASIQKENWCSRWL